MEPDPQFSERQDIAFRKKMADTKARLSQDQLEHINSQAAKLKTFQGEADSPQAAATLPKLKIEDIPRTVETIPTHHSLLAGVNTQDHDLFTNGIAYVDLAFDIAHVPEDLQPYLPLLGKIMSGMGAAAFSYDEMAKRIALTMGGFGYDLGHRFYGGCSIHLAENDFFFQGALPQSARGDQRCR